MRRTIVGTALGLAVAATGVGLAAGPAAAAAPQTGLGFYVYAGGTATAVLTIPDPDGACTSFPATANLLVGWEGQNVTAYATADCSGQPTALGSLRSFTAGRFGSFVAS